MYLFRIYVAGDSPNSATALVNLHAICQSALPNSHKIEVIDALQEPEQALQHGIMVTPTLIKEEPAPRRVIIGNLSDTQQVLNALGLQS
jgi:circadian clock protein KaiB